MHQTRRGFTRAVHARVLRAPDEVDVLLHVVAVICVARIDIVGRVHVVVQEQGVAHDARFRRAAAVVWDAFGGRAGKRWYVLDPKTPGRHHAERRARSVPVLALIASRALGQPGASYAGRAKRLARVRRVARAGRSGGLGKSNNKADVV